MYLLQTIQDKTEMQGDGQISPMFNEEDIQQADRLEVWSTSFDEQDMDVDYNLFKLLKGNNVIAEQKILGY